MRRLCFTASKALSFTIFARSAPEAPEVASKDHWQRCLIGHSAGNLIPVVASNRIGTEPGRKGTELTFYGSSFIADQTGNKVAEADRTSESVLTATFDLDGISRQRSNWGLFRDRRPELYTPLLTMDGRV